jgi:hypothetical protein
LRIASQSVHRVFLAPSHAPTSCFSLLLFRYFVPIGRVREASSLATDDKQAAHLWAFTEQLIAQKTA